MASTNPNPTRLFGAIVLTNLLWRLFCFAWCPLNFETWPGAAFEASAIASSGMLAIWLVLGDGSLPRRIIGIGLSYLGLRLAMDLGVFWHGYRLQQPGMSLELEFHIFRRVEDEVVACCLVLAIAYRLLSGWRITRRPTADNSAAQMQFRLIHLFVLTAVVSFLFAIAKSDWIHELSAEDQIMFWHAAAIVLAIFPALIIFLPQPRWWLILLMIATWAALSPLIACYFDFAGWLDMRFILLRHLFTTVLGPAVVTSATALALRRAGYRLQPLPIPVKRLLPAFNPPAFNPPA
jgi:hypothetical protein